MSGTDYYNQPFSFSEYYGVCSYTRGNEADSRGDGYDIADTTSLCEATNNCAARVSEAGALLSYEVRYNQDNTGGAWECIGFSSGSEGGADTFDTYVQNPTVLQAYGYAI